MSATVVLDRDSGPEESKLQHQVSLFCSFVSSADARPHIRDHGVKSKLSQTGCFDWMKISVPQS